jgi:hypothetical protein
MPQAAKRVNKEKEDQGRDGHDWSNVVHYTQYSYQQLDEDHVSVI